MEEDSEDHEGQFKIEFEEGHKQLPVGHLLVFPVWCSQVRHCKQGQECPNTIFDEIVTQSDGLKNSEKKKKNNKKH